MDYWETTPYLKWYKSHCRFAKTANAFIADFEANKQIDLPAFTSFIKLLSCHSKGEEKMFEHIENLRTIFSEHTDISTTKAYTEEQKYGLCTSLLSHMTQEEEIVKTYLLATIKKNSPDRI